MTNRPVEGRDSAVRFRERSLAAGLRTQQSVNSNHHHPSCRRMLPAHQEATGRDENTITLLPRHLEVICGEEHHKKDRA
jgi:hypothetical protein